MRARACTHPRFEKVGLGRSGAVATMGSEWDGKGG